MSFVHRNAADGKWLNMTLAEQLGNVGSEVSRTKHWKGLDPVRARSAFDRGLELFDLTLSDPRWHGPRTREIARSREVFCDAFLGGGEFKSSLEDLDKYLTYFAIAAHANK